MKYFPNNLSNLKSKVDKLDVYKLIPVSVDLSKLNDIVKNDVVKKNVYNADIKDIEDKIPDITSLATNNNKIILENKVKNEIPSITNLAATAALNAKINDVNNKIPNVTNLAITTALTAVKNKIPDQGKYLTTPKPIKLTAENFAGRLAQVNLASKSHIVNFIKKTDFENRLKNLNKKVTSSKTKHILVENEF